MSPADKLTAAGLRELLTYNPETGVFTWNVHRGRRYVAGKQAGTIQDSGHRVIEIDGRAYGAHRLAWLWMTGEWPTHEVDHRFSEPDDNRWERLREATHAQNTCNRRVGRNNTSGFKGVHMQKSTGRWIALIGKSGKRHHLGIFDTPEDAHAAYVAAAERLHGDFASAA